MFTESTNESSVQTATNCGNEMLQVHRRILKKTCAFVCARVCGDPILTYLRHHERECMLTKQYEKTNHAVTKVDLNTFVCGFFGDANQK